VDIYRVVLADDQALFRERIRKILEERPDLKVVGEAGDGLELLDLLTRLTPDLILLDISMPNFRGIDAISEIKRLCSSIKILILTRLNEKEFVHQALATGADGYFLKKDADSELISAIEDVRQGKIHVSPFFTEQSTVDWQAVRPKVQNPSLTVREREILKLIAEGKSNKQISEALFISIFTVKRHRANIIRKLNLKDTSLVRCAIPKACI
jgi:DNA-binding NarL/FixJ family response regulator